MGRPKSRSPIRYRRLTVLIAEQDQRAARIVMAARLLDDKKPGLGPALRDLLRREAERLESVEAGRRGR